MNALVSIYYLLSSDLNVTYNSDILEGTIKFKDYLTSFSVLKGDLTIWKKHVEVKSRKKSMPQHPAQAYKFADWLPILPGITTAVLHSSRNGRASVFYFATSEDISIYESQ